METSPVLLSRYTQDVGGLDSRMVARYIGNLEEGRSKVSVNSALSKGDQSDHFRIRVTGDDQWVRITTGELFDGGDDAVEVANNDEVRYQLRSPSGQLMADSDPNAGAAYDTWVKLTSEENIKLNKGYYTLSVQRGPDAVEAKEYIYSFTFRSGVDAITNDTPELASREFLTTERPAAVDTVGGFAYTPNGHITAILGLFADVRVF
ncbi:MAG: hypothetical protein ACYC2K_18460 [Gemmatimonadales bacterium]